MKAAFTPAMKILSVLAILLMIGTGYSFYKYSRAKDAHDQVVKTSKTAIKEYQDNEKAYLTTKKEREATIKSLDKIKTTVAKNQEALAALVDTYAKNAKAADELRPKLITKLQNMKPSEGLVLRHSKRKPEPTTVSLAHIKPNLEQMKTEWSDHWEVAQELARRMSIEDEVSTDFYVARTQAIIDYGRPYKDNEWPTFVKQSKQNPSSASIGSMAYDSIMETNFSGEFPDNIYASAKDKSLEEQAKKRVPTPAETMKYIKAFSEYNSSHNYNDNGEKEDSRGPYRHVRVTDGSGSFLVYLKVYGGGHIEIASTAVD